MIPAVSSKKFLMINWTGVMLAAASGIRLVPGRDVRHMIDSIGDMGIRMNHPRKVVNLLNPLIFPLPQKRLHQYMFRQWILHRVIQAIYRLVIKWNTRNLVSAKS